MEYHESKSMFGFSKNAVKLVYSKRPNKGCFAGIEEWEFEYLGTTKLATISGRNIIIDLPTTEFTVKAPVLSAGATITPDVTTITDWSKSQRFRMTSGSITKIYDLKVTVENKDIIYVSDLNLVKVLRKEIGKDATNLNHIDVTKITNMDYLFRSKKNI